MHRSLQLRHENFHLHYSFLKKKDSVLALLAVWKNSSIKNGMKKKGFWGFFFTFLHID